MSIWVNNQRHTYPQVSLSLTYYLVKQDKQVLFKCEFSSYVRCCQRVSWGGIGWAHECTSVVRVLNTALRSSHAMVSTFPPPLPSTHPRTFSDRDSRTSKSRYHSVITKRRPEEVGRLTLPLTTSWPERLIVYKRVRKCHLDWNAPRWKIISIINWILELWISARRGAKVQKKLSFRGRRIFFTSGIYDGESVTVAVYCHLNYTV